MSESIHAPLFEAPEVEEVTRLFPNYEILGLIACGGMGAVYHAIQTSLERPVAIKILPRKFSTDAEFRAGFESEAKAMAKLNHPNLISVFDFGEVEGMLFIVMEYVAGQSLHHAASGCAVESADAITLVIGVCHGLAHAHEFGILHRDIKPSNILLDGQMNPKIGDFGLARAVGRQIEEGEQIFGTPGYTAPEVLHPPFKIDQRADIFSVGVMLHELLTGYLPDADPRPASQICGCNRRLDAVILRATNPDPNRRQVSAIELAKELGSIAAMQTPTLRTGTTSIRVRPVAGASAVSRAGNGNLYRPVRAAVSISPRPRNPYYQPKTLAKQSSGSGFVVFLVIALVGAFIAYYVIKDRQKNAAALDSAAQKAQAVAAENSASAEKEAQELDAAEVLRRARSAIRMRFAPSLESYRQDMKANLRGYKNSMQNAVEELPTGDRERMGEKISANILKWEANGDELPETLPVGLQAVDGAKKIHASRFKKQTQIQSELEREATALTSVYMLKLQDQIELSARDGNTLAVAALEEEVRTVDGNVERFREAMTD